MKTKIRRNSHTQTAPFHHGQDFDRQLHAYTVAGRAAMTAGLALGATAVVRGQIIPLTASSFSPTPSTVALATPLGSLAAGQATQHITLDLQQITFGTKHPGFLQSVVQVNKLSVSNTHPNEKLASGNIKLNGNAYSGHGISF